jgi:hypothetical protein
LSFNGDQYPDFAEKVISTRGDIIRGNSSGERARYGIGAANTVLTSDGTDPDWAAAALAPTTTKGDISGFSTTQARIPISTNNFSILADSAQALGLKWAASSTSVMSGAQDILYTSAANTLARLAAGTDGDVLTTHGTGSAITWETPSGGATLAVEEDVLTSAFSTTSGTLVDVTGLTVSMSETSGSFIANLTGCASQDTINYTVNMGLSHDGTNVKKIFMMVAHAGATELNTSMTTMGTPNNDIVLVQLSVIEGGTSIMNGAIETGVRSNFSVMNIS